MLLAKRILLALVMAFGVSTPAFAANASGNGSSLSTLSGVYNSSLPSLISGQTVPLQVDAQGRIITAPESLIFGSPFQTYSATGVGPSTAFPATVAAVGTSLGGVPLGSGAIRIHLPPGSSVSYYVAPGVAASAAAAALVSVTRNNASTNTDDIEFEVALNGQFIYVTNYTSGTASAFISGKPIFRFI